jgi:hypothetical protein
MAGEASEEREKRGKEGPDSKRLQMIPDTQIVLTRLGSLVEMRETSKRFISLIASFFMTISL